MSEHESALGHQRHIFAIGLVLATALVLGVLTLGYAQTGSSLSPECINVGITDPLACAEFMRNRSTTGTAASPCGNNLCEPEKNETPSSCPNDCRLPDPPAPPPPNPCGNNLCEPDKNETPNNCPNDCPAPVTPTNTPNDAPPANTNTTTPPETGTTNTNATPANTNSRTGSDASANTNTRTSANTNTSAGAAVEVDPRCKEKGILQVEECRAYLERLKVQANTNAATAAVETNLDARCRERGITNAEDCRKLIETLTKEAEKPKLAPACVEEKITDLKVCNDFLDKRRQAVTGQQEAVPKECSDKGIFSIDECRKLLDASAADQSSFSPPGGFKIDVSDEFLPSECVEKELTGLACKEYLEKLYQPVAQAALPSVCVDALVSTADECRAFILKRSLPKECIDAGVSDAAGCAKFFEASALPAACRARAMTSVQACENLLVSARLSKECRDAGITDPTRCGEKMSENLLSKTCADARVTDEGECQKVVLDKYGRPAECQNRSDAECMELIQEGRAGNDIVDKLNADELTDECKAKGAKTFAECQELIDDVTVPEECAARGIANRLACEKFMFETFSSESRITLAATLPEDCKQAGANDIESCARLMELRYFPDECRAAGLTNKDACAKLIELRNLPALCREKGMTTRTECERLLREDFLTPACANQGILDSAACEAYITSKVMGEVTCRGISPDECVILLQKRSLGTVLEARSRIEEVRARLAELRDKHVVMDGGTNVPIEQQRINDILPLEVKERRGFRIIESTSAIEVTADERVISAAPAVVVYDNDGDGIPDDIEKRHGFDPTKWDSDDDGQNDGEELKALINGRPGGRALAPIERAMILGRAIGQPVVSGELDSSLKVETAANTGDAADAPIELTGAGKAGDVLTLFVYSELPLVATVTVDANGQWTYDVSDALKDGEHTVYVAINDDTGKVVRKSSPLSFFVRAARAATTSSFVDETQAAEDVAADEIRGEVNVEERAKSSMYMRYFLVGALVLLAIAGGVFYTFLRKKPQAL